MTTQTKPAIHAHRGGRGRRPENTLSAIAYALQHAADGVEVDLCVTADDEIVLHHDLCLNPDATRDARGEWIARCIPIRDLPLDALRRYDVGRVRPGSGYAKRFPEQTPANGARIPTLDECVELLLANDHRAILNLEMKSKPGKPGWTPEPEHYVSLVLKKLESLRFPLERVFLQSFDWELMQLAKRRRPDLNIGLLTRKKSKEYSWIHRNGNKRRTAIRTADLPKLVKQSGGDVWSCDYRGLTKPLLKQASNLKLKVYAWTVNEKPDATRMARWGVDAVTTDYPERCREWFHGRR